MLSLQALCIKLTRYLHYVYLLYAIPLIVVTAIITPPYQNPDEGSHFMRAEQVSRFEFVSRFIHDKTKDTVSADRRILYPDQGGFYTDKGILQTSQIFFAMRHHPEVKVHPGQLDSARQISWYTGWGFRNFANTALYPPVVYIMPALGISIGKLLHLSVINTLYLSRLMNGMLAAGLCFLALLLAQRSRLLMFIVLLFPMSLAVFSSVSQDAVLISCAFLLAGIIDSLTVNSAQQGYSKRQVLTLIVLMSVIAVSKPPYLLLALVFLPLKINIRAKVISLIVPTLTVIFWMAINRANYAINFAPASLHINARLQSQYVIHHPFKFIGLFFKPDADSLINVSHMFVGVLGWLDTELSHTYYRAAYLVLLLGSIIVIRLNKRAYNMLNIAALAAAFFTLIGVMSAQYITWTALESESLSGMQGRYLLPVFPFIALAVSAAVQMINLDRLRAVCLLLIVAFPLYTAIAMIHVLLKRFYI